jgi:hypothetical protein
LVGMSIGRSGKREKFRFVVTRFCGFERLQFTGRLTR